MYVKAIKLKELFMHLAFIFGGMCLEWEQKREGNELLSSLTTSLGITFIPTLFHLYVLQFGRVLSQTTV